MLGQIPRIKDFRKCNLSEGVPHIAITLIGVPRNYTDADYWIAEVAEPQFLNPLSRTPLLVIFIKS